MYNSKLEDKIYMLNMAENFAWYYSGRIKEAVKEGKIETTLILIRDFTPVFILGFASKFDNVRIILTQNYNFENDILFDIKNTKDVEVLKSYIRALYYKADELKNLIRNGHKIKEPQMSFNCKSFNMNRLEIVAYKIDFDLQQYVTKLRGFPALIIDARLFEAKVKENEVLNTKTIEFYDQLTIDKNMALDFNYDNMKKIDEIISNYKYPGEKLKFIDGPLISKLEKDNKKEDRRRFDKKKTKIAVSRSNTKDRKEKKKE
jgi:hypothetical protein